MWIILALLASVTSGIAVIFQKKGTAGDNMIQISAVHLLALFATVFCVMLLKGGLTEFASVPVSSWWLAVASGLVQVASWIAYFYAIKEASVSFLMVLDKTGIIVTMLLAALLFDEPITFIMVLGSVLILVGASLMGNLHTSISQLFKKENHWILWGIASPALQALSNTMAKLDTAPIDTSVTTTIRMFVVAVSLCITAAVKEGSLRKLRDVGGGHIAMLVLGGAILGVSYLFMYESFSLGKVSTATAIVRANFLVTTLLARIVFKEKLSRLGVVGFLMVVLGVALFVL